MSAGATVPATGTAAAAALEGICKGFPGVQALDDVTFDVYRGEIHALLGENGAGKSTLIKVLDGLCRPDAGRVLLDGEEVRLHSVRDARKRGVTVVPQDVLAVPQLSIGRNILLGFEGQMTRRTGLTGGEQSVVRKALERSGATFDPSTRAGSMSVPELRLAQIARALLHPGDVIALDEPTAVLSEADADLSLVGPGESVEDVHQRRLAGAVLAEQRVHLAPAQVEVDVVVSDDPGVTLGDPSQLEDRLVRHRLVVRGSAEGDRRLPIPLRQPPYLRAVGTLTVPAMIFALSAFILAMKAAGTFGLILPAPTPLFLRLKLRSAPPLNVPSLTALTAS